jgi:hypothetical protein
MTLTGAWIPPRSPEIDRAVGMAVASHRGARKLTPKLHMELKRHGWDSWEASHRLAPRYRLDPVQVFKAEASLSYIEGRYAVKLSHDGGEGWGTIGMQQGEVMAACRRLGILRPKAGAAAREAAWRRFHRDPAFTVLVGVDHVAWTLAGKEDVLPAIVRHNCFTCDERDRNAWKYGGSVLYAHRLLWRENLPFALAPAAASQ